MIVVSTFIDVVRFRYRTSEQTLDLDSRDNTTDDGVRLGVGATVRWNIEDAERASYAIADVTAALRDYALVVIRKEIGRGKLNDLLPERKALEQRVLKAIAAQYADWGIEAVACEIRTLEPPAHIVEALQHDAERARAERAKL